MAKAQGDLMTLTEVSKRTGISMPTLQRYKKLYQDRIPSEGSGRTQRYKPEAIKVFKELKEENVKKRGRPRKSAVSAARAPKKARGGRKAAPKTSSRKSTRKAPAKSDGGLLTLTEISKRTGISYPTLLRYVRNHLSKIPHKGSGRKRRYEPEAVDVFKSLREQSRRGPSKSSKKKKGTGGRKSTGGGGSNALAGRLKALESTQKKLVRMITRLEKAVRAPYQVTVKR